MSLEGVNRRIAGAFMIVSVALGYVQSRWCTLFTLFLGPSCFSRRRVVGALCGTYYANLA